MTTEKLKNAPSPLQQHFDFSDEDLAENVRGNLSLRQQQSLRWQAREELAAAWGFALILGLVCVGLSIGFLTREQGPDLVVWCLTMVFLLAIVGASIAVGWTRWQHVQKDLHTLDRRVDILIGPVNVYAEKYSRGSIRYRITVQKRSFDIPKKALLAFKNGARYHVYAAKASHVILSAQQSGPNAANIDEKQLYNALDMRREDLPANRQGLLSPSQRKKLRGPGVVYFLCAVLLICGGLVSILSALLARNGLGLPLGVVFSAAGLLIAWVLVRLRLDAWRGRVLSVEGVPQLQVGRGREDYVMIKDRTFKVPTEVMLFFNTDVAHRVYYTPITRTIVAAECLSQHSE